MIDVKNCEVPKITVAVGFEEFMDLVDLKGRVNATIEYIMSEKYSLEKDTIISMLGGYEKEK